MDGFFDATNSEIGGVGATVGILGVAYVVTGGVSGIDGFLNAVNSEIDDEGGAGTLDCYKISYSIFNR
jgi:hypothetical protein